MLAELTIDEQGRVADAVPGAEGSAESITGARVMASLHQGRVRRRTHMAFILPLATSFVATSAWGLSSGKAQAWFEGARATFGWSRSADPKPESETGARALSGRKSESESDSKPPPATEQPHASAPEPSQAVAVDSARPSASERQVPAVDRELELYRAAHRAHLSARDPSAPLAAGTPICERRRAEASRPKPATIAYSAWCDSTANSKRAPHSNRSRAAVSAPTASAKRPSYSKRFRTSSS